MNKHIVLAVSLALAGLSAPAFADGSGFIRVEGGRSDLDFQVDGFGDASDNDTTWGFRGGYWFNANFAVEGFYNQVYSATYNDGFDDYRIKLHGVGIGVAAKKNFGGDHKGFFIGGRAGFARGVATAEYDGSVEEAEASSAKPYIGVGAGYDFNEKFGLSLNYDRFKSSGDGLDVTAKTLTLGAELRF
ncbi:porin family protein [Agrilutibacter solisilvae]|uniref:Porin family protein n=1 Tax=Agrilutibacter solisilvae TaxID=2763317 RepID=A0A974Y6E0_9GAMM|nr:porin family protein [Lysobacter solisilvae]QSX79561.1 porin family protein [Lysobacter solisilvae]